MFDETGAKWHHWHHLLHGKTAVVLGRREAGHHHVMQVGSLGERQFTQLIDGLFVTFFDECAHNHTGSAHDGQAWMLRGPMMKAWKGKNG